MRNVIFFHNGSIGDFLMTLFLMENIHLNDDSVRLYIAVPRNVSVCRELATGYPYVTVLSVNSNNALFVLAPFIFKKVISITPPTPGVLPLGTKLAARFAALWPGSTLVGFPDKGRSNEWLYTKLLTFDVSQLYYKTMLQIVHALDYTTKKDVPDFVYKKKPDIVREYGLKEGQYVVLHPFGSNDRRSILGDDLAWLVRTTQEEYPEYAIVISGGLNHGERIPEEVRGDVVDICGKPDMHELATIIDSAAFFIGVDTGITHLASVLHKKSLVIAHNGTPHWLPYYNENATILYKIADLEEGPYEGRAFLEENRKGRVQYLDRVPRPIIAERLKEMYDAR